MTDVVRHRAAVADGEQELDRKIDGVGFMLKAAFVKKA